MVYLYEVNSKIKKIYELNRWTFLKGSDNRRQLVYEGGRGGVKRSNGFLDEKWALKTQ